MKNLTTKMIIAAATLVAAAGVASAQTLKAEVPFAFRVNRQVFAAGTYRISIQDSSSGNRVILIRSSDLHKQGLAVGYYDGEANDVWKATGQGMLSFHCGVSRCVLAQIWMGGGAPTLRVPSPGLGKDEPHRVAEVVMSRGKSE